jgi:hypothetical protein
MTLRQTVSLSCILGCLLAASATAVNAQARGGRGGEPRAEVLEKLADALRSVQQSDGDRERERAYNLQLRGVLGGLVGGPSVETPAGGDPMVGPVVSNAPYSGDAVTTVTQILMDGTRIEQSTTAKFYRDSAGRVRREQTIIGLDALNPSRESQTVITIAPMPGDPLAYQLDPTTRTARRVGRSAPALGPYFAINFTGSVGLRTRRTDQPPDTSKPVEESLGTRTIEGLKATGRRTTTTIPTGQIGNDRPIEITDERWESPELQVLLSSRHSDPRTGIVEYRLTNVSRAEPPADLFQVPPDYTVNEGGAGGRRSGGPGPAGGGGRGAAPRGGRGQ